MAKITFQTSILSKEASANSSINKIKLCGYLRKKRNKVGGWRKLWFVLHDRLLVSYASKEEYDNKLVSFKDVLNLVPGTQVRPMDGFRFTIETTTQVIYTFHCDDHTAYREWIAMLMDSAGSTLNSSRRFHYFSRDSMKGIQTKTKNCDLLTGAEHNVLQRYTNEQKEIINRNVGIFGTSRENLRKPWSNVSGIESQTLKKQIERMSISGNEEYRLLALTPAGVEKHSRLKLVTTQNTEQSLIQPLQQASTVNENAQDREASEPVYAVVDLKNKYDQRKKRSALLEEKRCSSYESIYHMEKGNYKEKSLESIVDVVYEDGDLFFNGNRNDQGYAENSTNELRQTEENIYEPINVGQKTSIFEFRKYIERFKLNPFMRTQAPRKLKTNYMDSRVPPSNNAMSRFTTLRWKLGKHRKSVQRRMRKLYSNEYEPNPLFQYHTEENRTTFSSEREKSVENRELDTEITRIPKETKEHSNEPCTRTQTEVIIKSFEHYSPLKKAVAKIQLFNISSLKNGPHKQNSF